MTRIPSAADLVVLGSGAAGLTAALTAAKSGAEVLVLEKSPFIGGTTAVSGGVIWVPGNHHMATAGIEDNRRAAIGYIQRLAGGRGERSLIDRYVDCAPEMVRFVEANLNIAFEMLAEYPDYQPEFEGGRCGGRSLDNPLFDTHELGEWRPHLRVNPITGGFPITITEAMRWKVFARPFDVPIKTVLARAKAGVVHGGAALIGRLLKACLAAGVTVLRETPAVALSGDSNGVLGVTALHRGDESRIVGRCGVVLATGGFEWNRDLVERFLGGLIARPTSPPSCEGDGLLMAMRLGARLGNMTEAWWCPAVSIPGETYAGQPLHRSEFSARCLPHSIIVNRHGHRFVSESMNYNDVTKPFFHVDPNTAAPQNLPAWLIVDQSYLDRYLLVTAVRGRALPDWIFKADSLSQLAQQIGVDVDGLNGTVARFNTFADTGIDLDFQRGESAFERFYGDPGLTPNPNLGRLEKSPFYALRLHPSTIGTKGGPATDKHARVLRVDGQPIAGLYAAGNVAASPMGSGYPGAGVTIGSAMTFGMLAAQHAIGGAQQA